MNIKTEIKKKYDTFAENMYQDSKKVQYIHEQVSPVLKYFRRRKVEAALELGKFRKGDRILEIGSNVGQFTTLLAERGFSMTGIDLSDKSVEIAKKNAQMLNLNIDYFTLDTEDLQLFQNQTFDGTVSFSTLRYVPNIKKALQEIFRVTKKGGAIVIDFPNRHCPWFTLLKNRFGVENHIHDHFYSAKELNKLFQEIGFTNIETRKIMFTHYTFPPRLLGLYKIIDSIGERVPLVKESAAIIFCKGVKI